MAKLHTKVVTLSDVKPRKPDPFAGMSTLERARHAMRCAVMLEGDAGRCAAALLDEQELSPNVLAAWSRNVRSWAEEAHEAGLLVALHARNQEL